MVLACAIAATPVEAASRPERRLLELIDSTRRAHGVPTLRDSPVLCRSARRQSRYMLVTDRFGHLASIRASGRFRTKGEALAMHGGWRRRPALVLRLWLRSPPHRRIVLSRRVRFAGVGAARGRFGRGRATTWTLHTGGL